MPVPFFDVLAGMAGFHVMVQVLLLYNRSGLTCCYLVMDDECRIDGDAGDIMAYVYIYMDATMRGRQ